MTLDDARLAQEIEAHLAASLAARRLPPNLREGFEYVLFAGGKRVRPALVLRAAEAVAGDPSVALPAASAIELVHTFSLVHDDLPAMDDDDLRRGRPTLHKARSEALAILAGDGLLALAFEVLAQGPNGADLCRELGAATGDMIAGQVYDSLPESDSDLPPAERLVRIHENKTRALIRCACRMGAISVGASEEQLDAVSSYGEAIGLMFQVVDDVLDVTQTTEHLGKAASKDEERGKLTYPGVHGLEGSLREVVRLRGEALDALEPLGAPAEPLRGLCERLASRTR